MLSLFDVLVLSFEEVCRVVALFFAFPLFAARSGVTLNPFFSLFDPLSPAGSVSANCIRHRYFSSNGGAQPPGPSAADAQLDKEFDELRSKLCPLPPAGEDGML